MFQTSWEVNEDIDCKNLKDEKEIIHSILRKKGITNKEEVEEFLSLKPQKTYDPFLMKNMKEIVEKIIYFIKEKKSIWIYGDYDVDGISSISLLVEFFSHFTNNLQYYIPLREEEGYGLNCDAIKEIHQQGAELIITVDCGATSVEEVNLAKSLGMDIIVTDHHNLSDRIPDCLILSPKQKDSIYPFSYLCGCGVAFKLAQAIQKTLHAPKKYLADVLDIVALATVADVVPLIDENRTLLKYGLRAINSMKRPGLRRLIEEVRLLDKEITSGHIGFVLAPHFNASGRIDDAKAGVKLLLSKDPKEIEKLVKHLVDCNHERKKIQEKGLEICKEKVEKEYKEDLFLVVDSEKTHEGVIGIVAGRIRDLYYKPTLIVTDSHEEGILKGSGRSIEDMDIYEEMKKCSDLFLKFGGHKNACGFSIETSKLGLLRERLNMQAIELQKKSPMAFIKRIKVDATLNPSHMTEELVDLLKKLEPFGMGNERPYFLLTDIEVKNKDQVTMGKNNEHLRIKGTHFNDHSKITAIGFSMAENYKEGLKSADILNLVGYPKINEWNGCKSIQFMILDMKE
ncbi:single-stranded-DNA-specific exonuclease RecJ [Inediibacterium massiliense]|uniref:single-stranded-DNA-specific exonuclease RecJ n=1 Tax=Inediibacterium massiliense TaxID=1658111 RepID=UPI0006B63E7E|nr:single-stranded-DNA-specific exonuclease RecJ [Inediibacterium massiliense]